MMLENEAVPMRPEQRQTTGMSVQTVQDFLPGAEVFNLRILTPAETLLQIRRV